MRNKKWISFLFLFVFLFSNVGLAVNIHYCQGEIERISLAYSHDHADSVCTMMDHKSSQDTCCEKPEIKKQDDCCKDTVVSQQPTDKNFIKVFPFELDSYLIPDPWNSLDSLASIPQDKVSSEWLFYCDSHAPPLFKLYCQFIFYA